MGAAKAAAEYVDTGAVAACKAKLEEEYEKMAVFEKQYGGRVRPLPSVDMSTNLFT
jgi:hypothetical protein